jgi:hypothetical protein
VPYACAGEEERELETVGTENEVDAKSWARAIELLSSTFFLFELGFVSAYNIPTM